MNWLIFGLGWFCLFYFAYYRNYITIHARANVLDKLAIYASLGKNVDIQKALMKFNQVTYEKMFFKFNKNQARMEKELCDMLGI